jgi:anti-anti-sigma factor
MVDSKEDGDACVLALTGELSLAEAPALERRLDQVLSTNAMTIVVDLAGVEFIDSTGLSVLVRAQQQASERGVELGVANPNAQASRLLSLTGLAERLTLPDQTASTPQDLQG